MIESFWKEKLTIPRLELGISRVSGERVSHCTIQSITNFPKGTYLRQLDCVWFRFGLVLTRFISFLRIMSALSQTERGRKILRGSSIHVTDSPRDSFRSERSLSMTHLSGQQTSALLPTRSEGDFVVPMLREDGKQFSRSVLSWKMTHDQSDVYLIVSRNQ